MIIIDEDYNFLLRSMRFLIMKRLYKIKNKLTKLIKLFNLIVKFIN